MVVRSRSLRTDSGKYDAFSLMQGIRGGLQGGRADIGTLNAIPCNWLQRETGSIRSAAPPQWEATGGHQSAVPGRPGGSVLRSPLRKPCIGLWMRPAMTRRQSRGAERDMLPAREEWIERDGELIWVAGWSADGVPYAIDPGAWWRAAKTAECGAGWARARAVLESLFSIECGADAKVEVGRVSRLGQGLSRQAYVAPVVVEPDPRHLSGSYVVSLPGRDAAADAGFDQRIRREMGILTVLGKLGLPLRLARAIGALRESGRLAMISSAVEGLSLDAVLVGSSSSLQEHPCAIVAGIAATIHGCDTALLEPLALRGYKTRREHAVAALRAFEGLRHPMALRALHWAEAHLPPATPAVLVHGDLLPQNILIEPGAPPAVIDWEYVHLGDPAYDLAIVTRGGRRPLACEGGFEHLLRAYAEARGGVEAEHVRVHELALAASWYRQALEDRGAGAETPETALERLAYILDAA